MAGADETRAEPPERGPIDLETARRALAYLRPQFESLLELEREEVELSEGARSAVASGQVERAEELQDRRQAFRARARELTSELEAAGARRGLDMEELLFPSELAGRSVQLSWRRGEETIEFYREGPEGERRALA